MTKFLLILIIVLGAFLRLVWLDKYPPGVTGDEIQQGYTAYSILQTGKDEWGDFLPVNPRGFGDYKPPLYAYLIVPFEALMGLNISAMRIPSALAGVVTVLITFFIASELFLSKRVALVSALLLAISPWHVQYSRVGLESNIGVLFLSLTVLFFIKSFKQKGYLIWTALWFGLTLFTYHSFRVFIILLLAGPALFYRKEILKMDRKQVLIGAALLSVFVTVVFFSFVFSGAGRRAADAAIYSQENIGGLRDIQVSDGLPDPFRRMVNNRWQYIASQFTQNYLGYYSPVFLFSPFRSDATLFNLPGKGLLYVWESVLMMVAAYTLIHKKQRWFKLILLWLLLAPVPAALTREFMHAQRVETFLPLLPMLSAFGLVTIFDKLAWPKARIILTALTVFIIFWSLAGRVDHYLFHMFRQNLGGLKYGYQEIVRYTEENKESYDQIIFTKVHSEPQAFVAFYSQMDPSYYQKFSQDWKYFEKEFKFLDMINYSLDKYQFRNIDWDKDRKLKNTLIVGSDQEIPDDIKGEFEVRGPNGKLIFIAINTSKINP